MKSYIINTLGPQGTDSFVSAKYWAQSFYPGAKIVLYDTFEKLFTNLHKGEFIVMPTGYCNRENENLFCWVDFHFKYIKNLEIVDSFILKTKPMVILNNKNYKYDKAVIQSATYQLLRQKLKREIEIDFASSKVAAYEVFVAKKYRYTLCSKSTIDIEFKKDVEIISEFQPKMVWVVYKCIA